MVVNAILLAQPQTAPPLNYVIRAELDPDNKMITGNVGLTYRNTSPDIISDLQFHAYFNGARNSASTYLREQGWSSSSKESFGYLNILSTFVNEVDESAALRPFTDPDGHPNDESVYQLSLRQPLMPGQSIRVSMQFEAKMPKAFSRTGYLDEFAFVAQWFPKLGVWETTGFRGRTAPGWNCHAFHTKTEFFANFANYEVTLTVPSEYKVGATGVLSATESHGATTSYTYQQDWVHDFAWVAWPHFKVFEKTWDPASIDPELLQFMAASLGETPETLRPKRSVEMKLMLAPEHGDQAERHFEALSASLALMGVWLGEYPYETLTMVSPPTGGRYAGGMEYPTFITIGTSYHNPSGNLRLEELVAHEFAHQYFYGLLASNEVEEAWLDEGFTSYMEDKILMNTWGTNPDYDYLQPLDMPVITPLLSSSVRSDMWDLNLRYRSWLYDMGVFEPTSLERNRTTVHFGKHYTPISYPSHADPHYFYNAYPKPAVMLHQLERELGWQQWAPILRSYVQSWRFKHPSGKDFETHVADMMETPMDWFFDPMLRGPAKLGFKVQVRRYQPRVGGWTKTEQGMVFEESAPTTNQYQHVLVTNTGGIAYPIDVQVAFSDGTVFEDRWDGVGSVKAYTFPESPHIERAVIDPDNKILYEAKKFDNSYQFNSNRDTVDSWVTRMKGMFQHLLIGIAGGL